MPPQNTSHQPDPSTAMANVSAIEGALCSSVIVCIGGALLAPVTPLAAAIAAVGGVGYASSVAAGWFLTGKLCPLPIVRRTIPDYLAMIGGGGDLLDADDWLSSYASRPGIELCDHLPAGSMPRLIVPTAGQSVRPSHDRRTAVPAEPAADRPRRQARPPEQTGQPSQPGPTEQPDLWQVATPVPEADYAPPSPRPGTEGAVPEYLTDEITAAEKEAIANQRRSRPPANVDELVRTGYAGSKSQLSLAPDSSLPKNAGELMAVIREQTPLYLQMTAAMATRLVGAQRCGKTYSLAQFMLWSQICLSDFARTKKKHHGRLVRVNLIAPGPKKGEEYADYPGWSIYGHDRATRETKPAELVAAMQTHRKLIAPSGEGDHHMWLLDECGRHAEMVQTVMGREEGLEWLTAYYRSILQESFKFDQPTYFIGHGDNVSNFPGAQGIMTSFRSQSALWQPQADESTDEYGVAERKPNGTFLYNAISVEASGISPTKRGAVPSWMTVEFLKGLLLAELEFHGRDYKEPY